MPRSYRRRKRYNPLPAVAFVAAVAVFCVSGWLLVNWLNQSLRANSEYDDYKNLAIEEAHNNTPAPRDIAPEPTPYNSRLLDRLKAQNQDTVAWIAVGNTDIRYPIVLTKDNDYYVSHTFSGKQNDSGAIFVDCRTNPNLTDFNTVVYGHNRRDGSMFAHLLRYANTKFLVANQSIALTTLNGQRRYSIFSAYQIPRKDYFPINRKSLEEKETFIEDIVERSQIATKYRPTAEGSMLTLVTCVNGTDDYWIIHARRTA